MLGAGVREDIMQHYQFKVVGLQTDNDKDEVRLIGKFHTLFSSQIFLKLPYEELRHFHLGDTFVLVPSLDTVIQTVALGGRTDIPAPSPDHLAGPLR